MAEPSIHYRRRWFYLLWSVLLLLSATALLYWETPAARELASLQVQFNVTGAPAGTRMQAWAGPWGSWAGQDWTGAGALADATLPASGQVTLPLVHVPIARRRFKLGYIPRGTWDLMMVRLSPPSEPARYYALPLSLDIRTGVLVPRHRLMVGIDVSWKNLQVDAEAPNRVP